MKRFSVVIPTYQSKVLIKNTLEALNQQKGYTKEDYEVIVVDDGSTDGTGDFIKGVNKNYELKYVYLERCSDSCRARTRNTGVKEAEGEIVIFLDGDILVRDNYLAEMDRCFKAEQNILVIGNRVMLKEEVPYEAIAEGKAFEGKQFCVNSFEQLEIRHLVYRRLSYNSAYHRHPWLQVYSCNMAAPKKVLDKEGLFDETFMGWGLEDIELGYRLYKAGLRIIMNSKLEVYHQQHSGNGGIALDRDKTDNVGKNAAYFIDKHPGVLEVPKPVAIEQFKGAIETRLHVGGGIFSKRSVMEFTDESRLEELKASILELSGRKGYSIIINDHVEKTDLDIWIQLLGRRASTPKYFPASKMEEYGRAVPPVSQFIANAIIGMMKLKGAFLSMKYRRSEKK